MAEQPDKPQPSETFDGPICVTSCPYCAEDTPCRHLCAYEGRTPCETLCLPAVAALQAEVERLRGSICTEKLWRKDASDEADELRAVIREVFTLDLTRGKAGPPDEELDSLVVTPVPWSRECRLTVLGVLREAAEAAVDLATKGQEPCVSCGGSKEVTLYLAPGCGAPKVPCPACMTKKEQPHE